MNLRESVFTCRACRITTKKKKKKRIQKFKETGDPRYIYQDKLD